HAFFPLHCSIILFLPNLHHLPTQTFICLFYILIQHSSRKHGLRQDPHGRGSTARRSGSRPAHPRWRKRSGQCHSVPSRYCRPGR
ncbi:hypothetical protein B0J18DRAFT_486930, partial [Chaetomium sp. MPI-SDFR-AT-0129]